MQSLLSPVAVDKLVEKPPYRPVPSLIFGGKPRFAYFIGIWSKLLKSIEF